MRGLFRLPAPWWAALVMAGVVSAAGATAAAATADLIGADPAAGTTVSGSPKQIKLSFSQPLEPGSRIDLFGGQFAAVEGTTTIVAGSEMSAVLDQALAAGTYTVQWSVVSDGGQTTTGSYQFGVAKPVWWLDGSLSPLVAAIATIVSGGVAVFVWILKRRQRL